MMTYRIPAAIRPAVRAAALAMLAGLGACGSLPEMPGLGLGPAPRAAATAPMPAPAPQPTDPLAAFAATATPGAQVQLALDGVSTPARLQRVYMAASGRECREVLLGTGVEERSATLCRGAEGWQSARPLLRGSGPRS